MIARQITAGFAGVAAAALLTLAAIAFAPAEAGSTAHLTQPPSEMLQDGLDALADDETDLARQLFEQLVTSHPSAPESRRALRELERMGRTPTTVAVEPREDASEREPANAPRPETPSAGDDTDAFLSDVRRDFATSVGDRVFFAENSSSIGGRARSMLDSQARWLKSRADVHVLIIGRSDDGGSLESAKDLSARRAEAVRDHLIGSGVAAERIKIDARGDRDPIATCRTFLCQAQNRNAETLLVSAGIGRIGYNRGAGTTDGTGLGPVAR